MKDLFYTESDNNIFWVSGYDIEHNNSYVMQFTQSIINDATKFAEKVNCKIEDVRSFVVETSRRYKHMRVFYVHQPEYTSVKDCYFIEKLTKENKAQKGLGAYSDEQIPQLTWTMWKWLAD
jgi:hypothetical protein